MQEGVCLPSCVGEHVGLPSFGTEHRDRKGWQSKGLAVVGGLEPGPLKQSAVLFFLLTATRKTPYFHPCLT